MFMAARDGRALEAGRPPPSIDVDPERAPFASPQLLLPVTDRSILKLEQGVTVRELARQLDTKLKPTDDRIVA